MAPVTRSRINWTWLAYYALTFTAVHVLTDPERWYERVAAIWLTLVISRLVAGDTFKQEVVY